MSAGGLMQLVAYGAQDIYLTNNPQTTFDNMTRIRYSTFVPRIQTQLECHAAIKSNYCPICCDNIEINDKIHTTICSHTYHHQCLSKYVEHLNKSNYNCPLCRTEISLELHV